MQNLIKSTNVIEKLTIENCFITEILNTSEHGAFSFSKARVLPNATTEIHTLKNTDEVYFILEGKGEMEIDGNIVGIAEENDLVFIPKNTAQRIKNLTDKDLIFICVCAPRFVNSNYF